MTTLPYPVPLSGDSEDRATEITYAHQHRADEVPAIEYEHFPFHHHDASFVDHSATFVRHIPAVEADVREGIVAKPALVVVDVECRHKQSMLFHEHPGNTPTRGGRNEHLYTPVVMLKSDSGYSELIDAAYVDRSTRERVCYRYRVNPLDEPVYRIVSRGRFVETVTQDYPLPVTAPPASE